jgi:hypothetical protein
VAGPPWSLLHAATSLALEGELRNVGIDQDTESVVSNALSDPFDRRTGISSVPDPASTPANNCHPASTDSEPIGSQRVRPYDHLHEDRTSYPADLADDRIWP